MATAKKVLLRPGVYAAPQGYLEATPERVRSWAEKFRLMRQAGIKIPVSWGHQPDAWPLDPRASDPLRARREYHLSAFNAGYLDSMAFGPDGLSARLDCPGVEMDGDKLVCWRRLPDGQEVKTAIAEVSVAIKDWRDGTGKVWDDAIIHVALTPLPVAHGTGGFQLSALPYRPVCTDPGSPFTLSLGSLLYTFATGEGGKMAKNKDDLDELEDEEPTEDTDMVDESTDEIPLDEMDEADIPVEDDPPVVPAPAPTPFPPPVAEPSKYFPEAVQMLRKRGIKLPDDTTPENFFERLAVAAYALEHHEATQEAEDLDFSEDEQQQQPDKDDQGVSYAGEDQGGITEEQRPVMMSLATAKTRAERVLLTTAENKHKARLKSRIEALKKRGVQPAKLARIEEKISGYHLSMLEDGSIVEQEVDFLLSTLEDLAPPAHPMRGLKTAHVQRRPGGRTDHDLLQQQLQVGDELAALAGYPSKREQKG